MGVSATKTINKKRSIPRKKKRTPLFPPSVHAFLAHRLTDIMGLTCLIVGLILFASLLTYASQDPSLNTAVNIEHDVQNILGVFGAYIADFFLQSIGLSSYIMATILMIWGGRILLRFPMSHFSRRVVLIFPTILATSIFLARIPASEEWLFGSYLGGSTGILIFNSLTGVLQGIAGHWAHNFVFVAMLVTAVTCFVFSCGLPFDVWSKAFMSVWRVCILGYQYVVYLFQSIFNWHHRHTQSDLTIKPERKKPRLFKGREKKIASANADTEMKERIIPVIAKVPEKEQKPLSDKNQPSLALLSSDEEWTIPSLSLLDDVPIGRSNKVDDKVLQKNAEMLQSVLLDYGVQGDITKVNPGPVVTLYEQEPAPGTKSSRVIGLSDDIARSMSAESIRVAVVPGKNVIGIEMPNKNRDIIFLKELLNTETYEKTKAALPLVLGKTISGEPIIADLARMPHLLVAGTTGSGKSVAINTMVLSLLFKLSPEKCRFIMIDPKMLELSSYNDIPHLLTPVVTEPHKAITALKWAVQEMEDRYRAMSKLGVRNVEGFNARIREAQKTGEILMQRIQTGFDLETGKPVFEDLPIEKVELPYIVIIVDEFADLMLVAGKEVENAIQRLAQMARAAGLHLIMATQRPSVDVITGIIKANFPTRISFQVTSKIDSRTILGEGGAESLLGKGDMLYMAAGTRAVRVHGPFVKDEEVVKVATYLKSQGEPVYISSVIEGGDEEGDDNPLGSKGGKDGYDVLYDKAVGIIMKERKVSTSFIQRHLQIGYNRAANIVETMERDGLISAPSHAGRREILFEDIE